MALQRRLMPSLAELVAFEAVARLGSFTKAAEELALTQGALSKQIRQLEETLGAELFQRSKRNIRITSGGEAYVDEIRPLLAKLENSTRAAIEANRKKKTLSVGVLPGFASRWLAPRLARFAAANRGVSVACRTYLEPFSFDAERMDAAIHVGQPNWIGTKAYKLFNEVIVTVASPAYIRALEIETPADLQRATLIHNATRPALWHVWFDSRWMEPDPAQTSYTFDHFPSIAAAAVGGLGVALVPKFEVEAELASGRLVTLFDATLGSMDAYFLVVPHKKANDELVTRFRSWLLAETRGETADAARLTPQLPPAQPRMIEYS